MKMKTILNRNRKKTTGHDIGSPPPPPAAAVPSSSTLSPPSPGSPSGEDQAKGNHHHHNNNNTKKTKKKMSLRLPFLVVHHVPPAPPPSAAPIDMVSPSVLKLENLASPTNFHFDSSSAAAAATSSTPETMQMSPSTSSFYGDRNENENDLANGGTSQSRGTKSKSHKASSSYVDLDSSVDSSGEDSGCCVPAEIDAQIQSMLSPFSQSPQQPKQTQPLSRSHRVVSDSSDHDSEDEEEGGDEAASSAVPSSTGTDRDRNRNASSQQNYLHRIGIARPSFNTNNTNASTAHANTESTFSYSDVVTPILNMRNAEQYSNANQNLQYRQDVAYQKKLGMQNTSHHHHHLNLNGTTSYSSYAFANSGSLGISSNHHHPVTSMMDQQRSVSPYENLHGDTAIIQPAILHQQGPMVQTTQPKPGPGTSSDTHTTTTTPHHSIELDNDRFITPAHAFLPKTKTRSLPRHITPEKSLGLGIVPPPTKKHSSRFIVPHVIPPSNDLYSIFLLVIQPTAKKFELIRINYHPATATIQDLIDQIPHQVTEEDLKVQKYAGLCRPHGRSVASRSLTDMGMTASVMARDGSCARILCGEVLVAIPVNYTGKETQILSQHILRMPKMKKLLEKSDPLSPNGRHRRSHRSGGGSSSSVGSGSSSVGSGNSRGSSSRRSRSSPISSLGIQPMMGGGASQNHTNSTTIGTFSSSVLFAPLSAAIQEEEEVEETTTHHGSSQGRGRTQKQKQKQNLTTKPLADMFLASANAIVDDNEKEKEVESTTTSTNRGILAPPHHTYDADIETDDEDDESVDYDDHEHDDVNTTYGASSILSDQVESIMPSLSQSFSSSRTTNEESSSSVHPVSPTKTYRTPSKKAPQAKPGHAVVMKEGGTQTSPIPMPTPAAPSNTPKEQTTQTSFIGSNRSTPSSIPSKSTATSTGLTTEQLELIKNEAIAAARIAAEEAFRMRMEELVETLDVSTEQKTRLLEDPPDDLSFHTAFSSCWAFPSSPNTSFPGDINVNSNHHDQDQMQMQVTPSKNANGIMGGSSSAFTRNAVSPISPIKGLSDSFANVKEEESNSTSKPAGSACAKETQPQARFVPIDTTPHFGRDADTPIPMDPNTDDPDLLKSMEHEDLLNSMDSEVIASTMEGFFSSAMKAVTDFVDRRNDHLHTTIPDEITKRKMALKAMSLACVVFLSTEFLNKDEVGNATVSAGGVALLDHDDLLIGDAKEATFDQPCTMADLRQILFWFMIMVQGQNYVTNYKSRRRRKSRSWKTRVKALK